MVFDWLEKKTYKLQSIHGSQGVRFYQNVRVISSGHIGLTAELNEILQGKCLEVQLISPMQTKLMTV